MINNCIFIINCCKDKKMCISLYVSLHKIKLISINKLHAALHGEQYCVIHINMHMGIHTYTYILYSSQSRKLPLSMHDVRVEYTFVRKQYIDHTSLLLSYIFCSILHIEPLPLSIQYNIVLHVLCLVFFEYT